MVAELQVGLDKLLIGSFTHVSIREHNNNLHEHNYLTDCFFKHNLPSIIIIIKEVDMILNTTPLTSLQYCDCTTKRETCTKHKGCCKLFYCT